VICLTFFAILFFSFAPSAFAQDATKEAEALFVAKKAFEDGFYEVSIGLLERFLKKYPDSDKLAEAELLIGQCLFRQNRFLDALAKFEELENQAYARASRDAIIYWIAEVHFRGNNFSKAADYYKKIIADFPNSTYRAAAYYSLGWSYFQEKLFSEAVRNFEAVTDEFPEGDYTQDSSYKIIEGFYNLKNYQSVKDRVEGYLKKYPKDISRFSYLHFYLAEANYYLDDFKEAIKEYQKVTSSTQDRKLTALSELGISWSYLKSEDYTQAEDNFSKIRGSDLEEADRSTLLLGRAIIAEELNRHKDAKAFFDQLLDSTDDPLVSVQAYVGKADCLYNLGDYPGAIEVYEEGVSKISEIIPQDMVDKLHYGLAWAFLKEAKFKEAIGEFQKVAKLSEERTVKISALCQIGDTYQDSGEFSRAIAVYDSILKDYPESHYSDYVQYQLGTSLLKTGNYDGAILAFQKLKKEYSSSKLLDDASYALGLSYFQRENYVAAGEIFENFQNDFKESNLGAQAMYLLGASLYNRAKFSEAIEVYKNIIRAYNQDSELVQKSEYEIADCFYRMGNEKEAMSRFKVLRTKYPDSALTPEVVWWLGEYYYRNNKLTLARRYFSSLIKDFPDSSLLPNAYYALASTYQEESQYEDAVENFQEVIASGRSDLAAQAAIAIADIFVREGKVDAALSNYTEVLNNFSDLDYLIYPKIADVYRNTGEYNQALEYYHKSVDIVPVREMSNIQFNIAETLEAKGDAALAIEEYLKVTYLYSEDTDLSLKALLRVAAIYEDDEDFKEALQIYAKITAMDVEEAKYAQERIDWIKQNF